MTLFIRFLKLEAGRLLTIRILLSGFCLVLLSVYLIHNGVDAYKNALSSTLKFREIERLRAGQYLNYRQYGALGFRINYLPPASGIFFYNSGLSPEILVHIDAGIETAMYRSINGRNLFEEKPGAYSDFSGLLLMVGSLVALVYGYEAFRNKEYLRFLSSLAGSRTVYIHMVLARLVLILSVFTLILFLAVIQVRLEGTGLRGSDCVLLGGVWGTWVMVSCVFFFMGTVIGTIPSTRTGMAILMASWMGLVFIFPLVIEKIVRINASDIELTYRSDLEKWNALMTFEKRATAQTGGKIREDSERILLYQSLVESFLNHEYKKIQGVDQKIETQMRRVARVSQVLSVCSPATFYQSLAAEMSGKGYEEINNFFRYCRELKHRFCLFYKEKRFYSRSMDNQKVIPFITREENVYRARNRFPGYFGTGLSILIVTLIGLILFSYYRYKRMLFIPSGEEREPKNVSTSSFGEELVLHPGHYCVLKTGLPRFADYLYGILSGYPSNAAASYFKEKHPIRIESEDMTEDMAGSSRPIPFLYLCNPEQIPPDIRVGDLLGFIAAVRPLTDEEKEHLYRDVDRLGPNRPNRVPRLPFAQLEKIDRFDLLLSFTHMPSFRMYVFQDITHNMPVEAIVRLKERMEGLAAQEKIVLCLTRDIAIRGFDISREYEYRDITKGWSVQVEGYLG
ncbi:MAG: hypothetical protein ACM3SY_18750 [Candidatus Omnitrophota bacterium]